MCFLFVLKEIRRRNTAVWNRLYRRYLDKMRFGAQLCRRTHRCQRPQREKNSVNSIAFMFGTRLQSCLELDGIFFLFSGRRGWFRNVPRRVSCAYFHSQARWARERPSPNLAIYWGKMETGSWGGCSVP
ncbi:unnamed protein product [Ectocarpus sp. 12 AP-2014]